MRAAVLGIASTEIVFPTGFPAVFEGCGGGMSENLTEPQNSFFGSAVQAALVSIQG